ncbi:unnamed protein product [Rhizoctonia solani]|uniref:HAT C-terminal dimerisation domain-containing protein n=1 Tax=Rhizoctonia solani TaxID=456999 RepID=A0A8H3CNG6_9AGAM|nr:unnamed protein product [Rhizoctonia solani]
MSPAPVTPTSPLTMTKFELKKLNKLSDKQIWSMSDEIIIAAALSCWMSYIYGHFKMFLERRTDEHGERSLWFRFECKSDPILHTQYRARKDTSSGTHNLIRGAEACDIVRKVSQNHTVSAGEAHEYSPTRLRALIALWCARNHRPFELFRDDLFTAIVNKLRPGTSLPDPSTISRDVRNIYFDNKDAIRQYFRQVDHIHLAMDGWTAPTSRSYLGVVAIWQLAGKLHRAILEFILLTKRHTGEYLAQQTAECLNKYGLGPKLLTVCMDNASNNNTFTVELQKRFPSFGGPRFRGRCGAHIVNLMAKAYLSIFSKPENRKRIKKGGETAHTSPKRHRITDNPTNHVSAKEIEAIHAGSDSESEGEEGPVDDIDEDKAEYDNATVKASVNSAFLEQLLPKIAGLANRAKRSPLVQQKFEQYVAATSGSGRSQHPSLPCSVATRWNTELISIRGHVQRRAAVKLLTADRELPLKRFQLTDAQWELGEQLVVELKAFERLTQLFSETQVPLIHQVIPVLLKLRDRLYGTIGKSDQQIHPLLRVASHAALKVFDKYMRLFEDASIYWVALVMCPHYKLEWFRLRQYSESDIQRIKELLNSTFKHVTQTRGEARSDGAQDIDLVHSDSDQTLADGWLSDDEIGLEPTPACRDTLQDYLSAPLVPVETLRRGDLLVYWDGQLKYTPRIAKFALSILSSPASSVDAERAFSGGLLTINHLQHSMGDVTFEAKMAVGSWFNTPLLPSVDTAASIVEKKARH